MAKLVYALFASAAIGLCVADQGWCMNDDSCRCVETPSGGSCLKFEGNGMCSEYSCGGGAKCDCVSGNKLCSTSICAKGSTFRKTEGAQFSNGRVACEAVTTDVMCTKVVGEYPLAKGASCAANGPTCGFDMTCSNGVCEVGAAETTPIEVGQSCIDGGTPCVDGAECSSGGVCSYTPISAGSACTAGAAPCAEGAECSSAGVCEYTPLNIGASCTGGGAPCMEGAECASSGVCVYTPVAVGDACTARAAPCVEGAECSSASVCEYVPLSVGASCAAGGAPCVEGAECGSNGVCAYNPVPVGSTCTAGGAPCEDGAECSSSGTCTYIPIEVGESCTAGAAPCVEGAECSSGGKCDYIPISAGESCTAVAAPCEDGLVCSPASKVCVRAPMTIVGRIWDEASGIVAGVEDKNKDVSIVPHGPIRTIGVGGRKVASWGGLEGVQRQWVQSAVVWALEDSIGYHFTHAPQVKLRVRIGWVESWTNTGNYAATGRPSGRSMHVVINGQQVERNLDVFTEAGGKDKVLVKTYEVRPGGKGDLRVELQPGDVGSADHLNPMFDFIDVQEVKSVGLGVSCSAEGSSCDDGLVCSPSSKACVRAPMTIVGRIWDELKGIVGGFEDKNKDRSIITHGSIRTGDVSNRNAVSWGGLEGEKRAWVRSAVVWALHSPFGYHFTQAPQGKLRVRIGWVESWHGEGNLAATGRVSGRSMHVEINGQQVERNIDVFTEAGGKDRALVKTYDVVSGGKGDLQIDFKPGDAGSGNDLNPMFDFIEVLEI